MIFIHAGTCDRDQQQHANSTDALPPSVVDSVDADTQVKTAVLIIIHTCDMTLARCERLSAYEPLGLPRKQRVYVTHNTLRVVV